MWQPNKLEQERVDKIQRLEARGVETFRAVSNAPIPARRRSPRMRRWNRRMPKRHESIEVTVCGRIRRVNIKGKLSFLHIEDESGRIQLFLRVNDMDEAEYNLVKEKLVDTDDFVQASGTMMRTKAGEISVLVHEFKLLSKSLSPLPVIKQQVQEDGTIVEFGEFSAVETRYRQRYADLAVNSSVRDVFLKRAKMLEAVRNFFDNEGFLEVETPILQPIYGGAAARPFITHHNQLDQDLYLRISFELYLKRLLVGGIDAVYELGRDFRNEGVSFKHNTEFTMLEFYKAYIDYNGVADLSERYVAEACKAVKTGKPRLPIRVKTVDFGTPSGNG